MDARMTSNEPSLSTQAILSLLKLHYKLSGTLSDLPSYIDLNRKLVTKSGKTYVVKIANASTPFEEIDLENKAMRYLAENKDRCTFNTPDIICSTNKQDIVAVSDAKQRICFLRVITFLGGDLWAHADTSDSSYAKSLGRHLGQLNRTLKNFSHNGSYRYLEWDIKQSNIIIQRYIHALQTQNQKQTVRNILRDFEHQVLPNTALLPQQVIHNDANDYNMLVDQEKQELIGIFDFGDMLYTYRIAELAIAGAYAVMGHPDPESLLTSMFIAYHQQFKLNETESKVLLTLIKARLAVSVCKSAYAFQQNPENEYLIISQQGAWNAIDALNQIDEISFSIKLGARCFNHASRRNNQSIIDYRNTHLSENLSLAYQEPLKIVAGRGAYLYDEQGNRYIDMVNNVCHVGHCHPRVVAAGQHQMSVLNTNTRYLHENIVNFTDKLLDTMPDQLSICMLVNSGSEANELALRLARNYTKNKAMLVVDGAYHGNSNACIDISPYKHNGKGGEGPPDWVKSTLFPDTYRGQYRGQSSSTTQQYVDDVIKQIDSFRQEGQGLCGFICESIQGVGGQVFNPPGYLEAVYAVVREAGGVCIADEVQVGLGRVGSHWWAFETQNVVPDIVTIGKPLGNGHPLAAVITTKEIADAFANGMEYFNTFGGNPVSCAIGEAVLDVIEQESLMQHADKIGRHLKEGLQLLMRKHPLIGDVRGEGMFIGCEFVRCRKSLEPATEESEAIIEALKQANILLTTEGPFANVLKIKPPLAFSTEDADYFLSCLDSILSNIQS
jgi:4-aminobutyrate aminotransferase-like enzyme/Ser/Thr protein kinase RdoA (MazF antagonist)